MFQRAGLPKKVELAGMLEVAGMLAGTGPNSSLLPVRKAGLPGFVKLVEMDGEPALDFQYPEPQQFPHEVNPELSRREPHEPDLSDLLRFAKLKDAKAGAFLSFARRCGRLNTLCKHRVEHTDCGEGCEDTQRESIALWRDWSKAMGAVLNISIELHTMSVGKREDWSVLDGDCTVSELHTLLAAAPRRKGLNWQLRAERCLIGAVLDRMLFESGARLSFDWDLDSITPSVFVVPSRSLLAALVCNLAFAVAQVHGVATCDSCGKSYTPARKPQQGRNKYCEACRATAPARDHGRRKRSAIRG